MKNSDSLLNSLEKPMTVSNWLIIYLLLSIPVANIVLLFIWAFQLQHQGK